MGKHRKRKEDLDKELSKLRRKIKKLEEKMKGSSRSRSRQSPTSYCRTRSRSPQTHARSPSVMFALSPKSTHSHSPKNDCAQYSDILSNCKNLETDQVLLVAQPEANPPSAPIPFSEQDNNMDIDIDILTAMGSVEEEPTIGSPAHNEIVQRWTPILKKGLKKEEKTLLLKEYIPYNNIPAMIPPKLNVEVSSAVSEQVRKRDSVIEPRQRNVAAALSAIGKGLECFLTRGNKVDGIKKFNDASKILCEIIHNETLSRRSLIRVVINKYLKDSLQGDPDEFLFGTNLTERIKVAKAVKKSAQDLSKITTASKQLTHQKALNSWAPPHPNSRPRQNRMKNEDRQGGGGKRIQTQRKTRQPVRQIPRQQRSSHNRQK